MKLSNYYAAVVTLGKAIDPRKNKNFTNFEDTSILYGDKNTEVKTILAGIDIETAELVLADRLRQKNNLDLVVAHHPEGWAYASLFKVMRLQVDILKSLGIDPKVAEQMMEERIIEVERRIMPQNHMRSVDAARLLDMPFICTHTPADNHVYNYLKRLFTDKKSKTVKDILEILFQIPEYKIADKFGAGPKLISGSLNRSCGKILFEMTGGTEGSKKIYDKIKKTGVKTIVCMHLSEEHFAKVKDNNINVIIAGHIASDNLGMNLLFDAVQDKAKEEFNIIGCSGFNRVTKKERKKI